MKELFYRILSRTFPALISSEMKIRHLQRCGVPVGNHTIFYNAGNVSVDCTRPALLQIGDYCKITAGTIILTHDYSRSVLRRAYGEIINEARKTIIGDNVFIGMRSIILMGTRIGDNCIIGAGSVCRGSYPANSVIAGNPAKVICSLDDYYAKRKEQSRLEAMEYAKLLQNRNGRKPSVTEMGAFFPLYLDRSTEALRRYGLRTKLGGDDENEVIRDFLSSTPEFASYEEFLEKALNDE